MPTKSVLKRVHQDRKQGKSPSTQAGEFVHDVIRKVRKGKYGVRSAKQAIAIGLSEARKAGVKLPSPPQGSKAAEHSVHPSRRKPSAKRSRASLGALKREPRSTVSHEALAKQTHEAAIKRGPSERHQAAVKAVRTKGAAGLHRAAKKAAHIRLLSH